jgi:hypothetical protein
MPNWKRRILNSIVCLAGAVVGVGAVPAVFIIANRLTVLRWSNEILDLISRS